MKIKFWKTQEPYGEFSNFYPSPMIINGKSYATVEHYYQSQKFKGTEFEEIVRTQSTARKAKNITKTEEAKFFFREDWVDIKFIVMSTGLFHKFKIERFRNLLLSTGNKEIIEDSPYDYYWGCGADDTGKNVLGKLIMGVRENIKESNKNKFID